MFGLTFNFIMKLLSINRGISEAIKQLRMQTGAPLHMVYDALKINNQDIEAATKWLQKEGIKIINSKSLKGVTEGISLAKITVGSSVIASLKAQTDFAARNEKFVESLITISEAALKFESEINENNLKQFIESTHNNVCPKSIIEYLIKSFQENCVLKLDKWNSRHNLFSYVHNHLNGVGSKSAMIEISNENGRTKELEAIADKLLLQGISNPIKYITRADPKHKDDEILYEQDYVLEDKPIKVGKLISEYERRSKDKITIHRLKAY